MIRFERIELINALKAVINQVPQRPTHPVLGTLLFKFSNGIVEITAFDLSELATARLPYILPTTEDVAINFCLGSPSVFNKLINTLDTDYIDIEPKLEEATCHLNADGSRYDFPIMGDEEYPDTVMDAKSNPAAFIQLDDRFSDAFQVAVQPVSTDSTKQVLTGINFRLYQDGAVKLVGTDGHRLTTARFKSNITTINQETIWKANEDHWDEEDWARFGDMTEQDKLNAATNKLADVTVCPDVLSSVVKTADSFDIYFGEGVFNIELFKVDGDDRELLPYSYAGRIKDGAYPAVEQLIPVTFKYEFYCSLNRMIDILERFSLFPIKNSVIHFNYNSYDCEYISLSVEDESRVNTEKLTCKSSFDDVEQYGISFNLKYLMEALKAFKVYGTKEVLFKLNEPNQAIIIEPIGSVIQTLTLLMPVQIRK
jgi:DNA polymerase-3 subunit beta